MKRAFFLWFVFYSILPAAGQLPDYYVYLFRGDIQVKQGNKKAQKVKPRMLLYRNDVLTSNKKNGEIILVDKNENFINLKIQKEFRVEDALKIRSQANEGITKKYLHLLWEELLKPHTDFNAFRKSSLVHVVGGVERGSDCDVGGYPVNGTATALDPLNFYWSDFSASGKYNFRIYEQNGRILYDITISDTQLLVHPQNLLHSPRNQYYWSVTAPDKPCTYEEKSSLLLLTYREKQNMMKAFSDSVAVIRDTLQRLLNIAEMLERNGMISEAEQKYEEAMAYENTSATALMLSAFYLRVGLANKAKKIFGSRPLFP